MQGCFFLGTMSCDRLTRNSLRTESEGSDGATATHQEQSEGGEPRGHSDGCRKAWARFTPIYVDTEHTRRGGNLPPAPGVRRAL